jgi:hypothetical protein
MLPDDITGIRSTFIPMRALIQRLDQIPEWQTHLFGNASLFAICQLMAWALCYLPGVR